MEGSSKPEASLQQDELQAEALPRPEALASPERSAEDEHNYKVSQRSASSEISCSQRLHSSLRLRPLHSGLCRIIKSARYVTFQPPVRHAAVRVSTPASAYGLLGAFS